MSTKPKPKKEGTNIAVEMEERTSNAINISKFSVN